jgi:hypothetical protein
MPSFLDSEERPQMKNVRGWLYIRRCTARLLVEQAVQITARIIWLALQLIPMLLRAESTVITDYNHYNINQVSAGN